MTKVIGRCSICNGRVTVPTVWLGIYPPAATCENCGATEDNLPVIKMKPSQKRNYNSDFYGVPLCPNGLTRGKITL